MWLMESAWAALCLMVVLAFAAQVDATSGYDFGNDVFQVDITGNPDKAGNPKYSFTWLLSDDSSETYDVAWQKVYETPCDEVESPPGNKMVNLNSYKWDYDFSDDTALESFSMASGPVDAKLTWGNLIFDQAFNSSSEDATHMKFSLLVEDYQWQDESASTCLLVQLKLSDASDDFAECQQLDTEATMVGNGYIQQVPGQAAFAFDPDTNETIPVNFSLSCKAGSQTMNFLYSSFPSGWTMVHDPNIGVNSYTDPMYGVEEDQQSPATPTEIPWGKIGLLAGIGTVFLVVAVVAIIGSLLLIHKKRVAAANEYDPLNG